MFKHNINITLSLTRPKHSLADKTYSLFVILYHPIKSRESARQRTWPLHMIQNF
jgi:hypothetical protein